MEKNLFVLRHLNLELVSSLSRNLDKYLGLSYNTPCGLPHPPPPSKSVQNYFDISTIIKKCAKIQREGAKTS